MCYKMVFSNCSLANPMDIINQLVQKIPDHCFVLIRNATNRTAIKWKVWWHLNFPWTFCFSVFNCFFTQLNVMFISSAFFKIKLDRCVCLYCPLLLVCLLQDKHFVYIDLLLAVVVVTSYIMFGSCGKKINPLHSNMSIHVPYAFL